ncbi:DUF418 domain-containing protein [Caulobacter sp. ErkDOM-E]|uniref:DUF418 domain-containing protein n=1 Tax=Caulobacter sp. ErkDOM-E TaxID=3402778 RepID=UPI003AF8366C
MNRDAPNVSTRNDLIDTLRAFALIGVFMVHMFEQFEIYWASPQQTLTHTLITTLMMGKAFALLALCFGLSFFLLMDRSARRGEDFSARFVWRMALLAVIGMVHGLIYRGDILVVLALLGIPLIPFYRASTKALAGAAALFLLQPWMWMQIAIAASGAPWANTPPHHWTDPALALYQTADLAAVLKTNLFEGQLTKWWFFIETGRLSLVLGLFLIGLMLGRSGFLDAPQRFIVQRRVALAVLATTALALYLAKPHLTALLPETPKPGMARVMAGNLLGGWFDMALMGTYVLLIVEAYQGLAGNALRLLAPIGRMTLTFYVVQSLIWVPVFYGFGLGAWKTLPQGAALGLGAGYLVIQAVIAQLWFRRFAYGPLEWAWRVATYRTWKVPFVRRVA